jgi:hypothetical protein
LPAAFDHVHTAILDLLDLPEDLRGYLAATRPTYNDRIHANIRGVVDGNTSAPELPTAFRELDFRVDLVDLVSATAAFSFDWNRASIPTSPTVPY